MIVKLPEQLDKQMILLVIIGHGEFPLGIKSSLEMISGDTRNIAYLCFEEGDNPDEFGNQINMVTSQAPCGSFVLIDLMGGTPFNQFCINLPKENCQAVCGVNLAMVLEVASTREYATLDALVQTAIEAGGVGIVDVYSRLNEKKRK